MGSRRGRRCYDPMEAVNHNLTEGQLRVLSSIVRGQDPNASGVDHVGEAIDQLVSLKLLEWKQVGGGKHRHFPTAKGRDVAEGISFDGWEMGPTC